MNDVKPGSDRLRILEFEKNSELRFDARGRKLIFQTSSMQQGAARGGVRRKRQHRKKLCLSLLMSKNLKLKKVSKSFVPEPRNSSSVLSVFGFLYAYEHNEYSMNIFLFHIFISWSYFWT